jgi:hypothetical protein
MFARTLVLALTTLALGALAEEHYSVELVARSGSAATRGRALSKRAASTVPLADYYSGTDLQYVCFAAGLCA